MPEIASRRHVEVISQVVREAMSRANVRRVDLEAIGATYGPGLAGALLVGFNFARGLALALGIRCIPVNHLEGHLHSVWLANGGVEITPELPMMALIVSGGHTELVLMKGHGDYLLVGRTRDDAAGEAFDKVARLIGLPYPGGPSIQEEAKRAAHPIRLPQALLRGTFDFSFSGLKTAVLRAAAETLSPSTSARTRGVSLAHVDIASELTPEARADLAAGFQESVVDVLVAKTRDAAEYHGARSLAVVGGVAANQSLREKMIREVALPVYVSPPELSTDNAAMIAAAAFYVPREDDSIDIAPGLRLVGT